MSLANWMSQLPPELTCRPIYTLKIPGSHDSGATNFLNDKLPVANDEDVPIQQLGRAFCIRRGIKRWAVCQSCSIRDQLDHGIRYLDLRVSNPPVGVRKSKTDFRLIHALYGPKLHNVFREILDFLTVNTKEVILLDMNHLYDFDLESYCVLQTLAMDSLGQDLFCPVMNPDDVSLDFMWQNGYRVIAFSSLAGCDCDCPVIWPGCLIPSPWPNTNNVDALIQILESQLTDCRKNSTGFFVTQGVLTPRSYDVVAKWFSTLRAQFAQRATDRVLSWLDGLEKEKREMLNVVILDFIDDASSRKIISLNAESIPAPTNPDLYTLKPSLSFF